MIYWLAQAAKGARVNAGRMQVHVAASINVHQSTVARFEDGEAWPKNPERMLAAYADDLDLDVRDLWEAGVTLWREKGEVRPLSAAADLGPPEDGLRQAPKAEPPKTKAPAQPKRPRGAGSRKRT